MKTAIFSVLLAVSIWTACPALTTEASAATAKSQTASAEKSAALSAYRHAPEAALQRFANMRFGIMFHWGPAVLRNQEISWSMSNRAKYESVYQKFDPKDFDPDAWAKLGNAVGARYMIYVCKHHDGFCMWNTKTTDNNIMNTPFKRDVVGELATACRRHGLVFGTYLSIMDIHEAKWNHCYPARTEMPGYPAGIPHIAEFTKQQTLELLKKYHSRIMWYDGGWLEGWRDSDGPFEVAEVIRKFNPNVLITRLGNQVDDYECMEARIGAYRSKPWEMVTSVAYPTYSYNTRIKYKPAAYFIQTLSRVVCGNGNLLLNFVPNMQGAIPDEQLKLAREIGGWLKINGEAVYGTLGGPWYPGAWGGSTRKGKDIFVYLLPDAPGVLHLPSCGAKVVGSRLLGGGTLTVTQSDDGIEISVPESARDSKVTVVELTMDKEVNGMIEASKHLLPARKKKDALPPPREEIK